MSNDDILESIALWEQAEDDEWKRSLILAMEEIDEALEADDREEEEIRFMKRMGYLE